MGGGALGPAAPAMLIETLDALARLDWPAMRAWVLVLVVKAVPYVAAEPAAAAN